jgi:hypothetical protein
VSTKRGGTWAILSLRCLKRVAMIRSDAQVA